jgi:hypothetical protein
VLLYIVPAKVGGAWQTPQGVLTIEQTAQTFTGTLGTSAIADGKVTGDEVSFTAGGVTYTGRLSGDRLAGSATTPGGKNAWSATRSR